MELAAIEPQMDLAPTQVSAASSDISSTFDKDGFLKLLVAQLENQDPLEPMKNEEYMAQMTQFSMLEELQNMGSSFSNYTQSNMVTSAANLVGKEVTLQDVYGQEDVGTVEKIRLIEDTIKLYVNGGWRDMTDLVGVSEVTTPVAPTTQPDAQSAL